MEYTLHRMTRADAPLTVDWMVRQYGFDRTEVEQWVKHLHFNWTLSVKAIAGCVEKKHRCEHNDKPATRVFAQYSNNEIIGLLNMSDYRIEEESEQIAREKPELLTSLNAQRYTAVFSFIVAPGYRGTRLNYDMLMNIMPELKANYDFIFVPVMHHLKTHYYWQRWGAVEFYRDETCVYYRLPLH